MTGNETKRLRQQAQLEQILAGLEEGNPFSESRARTILGRVAYRGSVEMLRRVVEGLLLTNAELRRDTAP